MSAYVRRARSADAEALAALATELGYPTAGAAVLERLSALAEAPGHAVFVAEGGEGADILGWIHLMPQHLLYMPSRTELGGLFVRAEHRREGVGRALVNAAEEWARGEGYTEMVVRSNVARAESHAFYPGVGFRVEKTQKVYVKEIAGDPSGR